MKLTAATVLCYTCGLSLLAMAHMVFASDNRAENQPAGRYDIELQVPAGQRKLLEDHLDLYRWRDSERMNETQLRRLLGLAPQQIRALLATEGYYSPQIDAKMERSDSTMLVSLIINPGIPVRVSAIDLQVAGPFNDGSANSRARLEKMRAEWRLRSGAIFRHSDWESAKRNALKMLLLDGYPTATIGDSRATINPETGSAELQLSLNSGPLFTFGKMEILGLQRYPASLIERMTSITPGETYSQNKLLELQARLQDSPYFSRTTVSVATDPMHPSNVPVRVEVIENPSRKLGFGIGISTDTGERLLVDYRDLSLLDRTWQLGGALKLDLKRQSLGGDLQFPPSENGSRDSINSMIEHTDIEGEETRKFVMGGKRAFVSKNTETAYGLRYFIEKQYIAGVPSARSSALSPTYSLTQRNFDQLLYPTSGYLMHFETDAATHAMLSDQTFLRGDFRAVYLHPLGANDQLSLRSEMGVVIANSRSGIPSDFLFRTGGDQTVRGYAYQSLGVHEANAIVGGRYLALASIEYVHWLTSRWGAAIFIDGGNAADDLSNLAPAYGYGVGARWKSPIGLLNLDLAYGEEVRQMRLHFSVWFNF